jgi:hypothetical protein
MYSNGLLSLLGTHGVEVSLVIVFVACIIPTGCCHLQMGLSHSPWQVSN